MCTLYVISVQLVLDKRKMGHLFLFALYIECIRDLEGFHQQLMYM